MECVSKITIFGLKRKSGVIKLKFLYAEAIYGNGILLP